MLEKSEKNSFIFESFDIVRNGKNREYRMTYCTFDTFQLLLHANTDCKCDA